MKISYATLCIMFMMLVSSLSAETLYINPKDGSDDNIGTEQKPLRSLLKAAQLVNANTTGTAATIKLLPGIYNLAETVTFDSSRAYSASQRLTIQAAILPDDPQWKPTLMPIILSTYDPRDINGHNPEMGSYGIKVNTSYVTVAGLKFLGSPVPDNMYCPLSGIGSNLKDINITQCMFIGDPDTFSIYCPLIATADSLVIDHCIFHKCSSSPVFWDGFGNISYKNSAMKYCIVDSCLMSGVWTCRTAANFEFHNNIINNTDYFWLRAKEGKPIKYKMKDCIVNVKHFSGYAIETGPQGKTGKEVQYEQSNILKDIPIKLGKNKSAKNYLHVAPGKPGSNLGAGLFKIKKK